MLTTSEQTQLKARNGRLEEALSERDRRLERLAQSHAKKKRALTREKGELAQAKRELESELLYVRRQLEALKRKLFGQSRSEQVSAAQLQLALQEMEQETLAQLAATR